MTEEIDGSIHSIHVRNFFCHDNLEVNLNKNVNFIVGRNGSGKSAILTALVVGLGGRASATNRGSNLHSFIKKGANSATVEIKIKNSSSKAFKHSIYGDYITIVRNITASGSSSYKVKSATGEVISTKFEEVNAIILAHDIQVDNPISVLNQDEARSFHASDAKKKYSLFRKATNLDQTESNYIRALENCKKAISIWKKKTDACAELEKEYKKWKASYEYLQSRDEFEVQKQALQNEYYWSEIAEFEKEVAFIQTQYDKQNSKCEKLTMELQKMEARFGGDNGIIEKLKADLEEKTNERIALEQALQQMEGEVHKLQTTWRSEQHAVSKLHELQSRENRKVVDLEREIRNIECGNASSRRQQLEAAAEAARSEAAAVRARYETAQHDAAQARAHAAHAQQPADAAAARAQRQRDVLSHFLKLKEKKWGGAIEHILGGSIQSFCVNTSEDSRKLFEIMGQVYGKSAKPSVTCSQFLSAQHDVRRNKVRAPVGTCALDALHVADPVVANFLIDNLGLESILLVAEHEDAIRLADTEKNVPERCAKIVTLDGTEYHPAPNYRSYGGAARPARLLHLSTAERKKQILAEIQEAETTLKALEAKAEELNQEARRAREQERAASKALQALLAVQHDKEEAVRRADAALDQQQAPHHAVLVEELNVTKEKLRALNAKVESCAEKESEMKRQVEQQNERMKQLKPKLSDVTAACRDLVDKLEQEQMKVDRGQSERRTYQHRLTEERSKLSQIDEVLKEKQALVAKKVTEALTLCPRVEDPRDKVFVTNELKKIQLKLGSIRSDGLGRAEVAERLSIVERKYRRTKQTLDRLRYLIDEIKSTTDKHLKFCHKMQTYIARRVQYCFQSILTLRGYSGRMEIDQAAGTLEIVCSGRESGESRRAASTSSLSGGERSYSTVAFIMALWECVELPFYFMDEFDVFMDNVNRKIVLELLVDHALRNTSRQFVFLTPQDSSAITSSPNISIHLMADPRP
ncbi:structural maintenance of chromosomes protein 6 isoform X2 [Battus philenor]|uniref:structural maintenance of chromosomes protein 6 isoform X2 n=1 Tax=Battus philenor TaxID=42288 RepID=UPI0035D050BF